MPHGLAWACLQPCACAAERIGRAEAARCRDVRSQPPVDTVASRVSPPFGGFGNKAAHTCTDLAYLCRCFEALRTPSTLVLPVSFRMVSSVALGENCGIGVGRFLLSVSPRFC